MTFPSTSVLDQFNRAAPLGSGWSSPVVPGDATPTITSNQVSVGSAAYGSTYWNAGTFGPDGEVYITIPTLVANNEACGIFFRVSNPNAAGLTCYLVEYQRKPAATDLTKLFRYDNSTTLTQVGSSISQEFSAGDTLGVKFLGSTYRVYRNGAQIGSDLTDATYKTAGYIGLELENTTGRLDDFGGGTVTNTLEQEGYRWRNDDGSESAATWAVSQDTTHSVAVSTPVRLRTLINQSNQKGALIYKLQYRKSGDDTWLDIGS